MFIPQKMGWLCRYDFVIDCTTLDISEAAEDPNDFFYLVLLKRIWRCYPIMNLFRADSGDGA